ncbi:response regulator [Deinococcus pimensis]|uniref:response regulator n=1 Tax=Deinococcus pimensis TaxID=309888 RepID=UPI0004B9CB07|nr:response regulator [Deinococcus pimensis]
MPLTPCILLIEDHEGYAYLVERHLRGLLPGVDVTVVHSGEDAVSAVGDRPFDLVLLDLDLPGLSGLDVLRLVKGHADRQMLPVVVLSQHDADPFVWHAYHEFANAFVVKPNDIDALEPMLRALTDFWFRHVKRPVMPANLVDL